MRTGVLDDALKTHQYTADCVEAETWMNEKKPLVSNTDYGKDEDSAQVHNYLEFKSASCILYRNQFLGILGYFLNLFEFQLKLCLPFFRQC